MHCHSMHKINYEYFLATHTRNYKEMFFADLLTKVLDLKHENGLPQGYRLCNRFKIQFLEITAYRPEKRNPTKFNYFS